MRCPNGHPVSSSSKFCIVCGQFLVSDSSASNVSDAVLAAEVFGLACPNGHPIAAGGQFCTQCGLAAPDFSNVSAGSAVFAAEAFGLACPNGHPLNEPGAACSQCVGSVLKSQTGGSGKFGNNKPLVFGIGGLALAMILALIVYLVIPSGGPTRSMVFRYSLTGQSCSQSNPLHNGTIVEVSATGGKLLTTGTLQHGMTTTDASGTPTCTYQVKVNVPTNVGSYYFRAMGDRNVYKVLRSTIDSAPNGWMMISTVATGVVVTTWTGSVWSSY